MRLLANPPARTCLRSRVSIFKTSRQLRTPAIGIWIECHGSRHAPHTLPDALGHQTRALAVFAHPLRSSRGAFGVALILLCVSFLGVCVTQKRAASGQDASIPFSRIQPHPSTRGRSEDWVTQTQDLRLESPSLSCSGFNTPVSQPGEVRIDEVMVDEDMVRSPALIPPPRSFITPGIDTARGRECHAYIPQASSIALPQVPQSHFLCPPENPYTPSTTPPQYPSPSLLQIPLIHIQNATPSPVQPFPQVLFEHDPLPLQPSDPYAPVEQALAAPAFTPQHEESRPPYQNHVPSRKQRFTMGPRADCELCRNRVKGHYIHL